MVELGSRCATERAQIGNSPPKVARACALLDSLATFTLCPHGVRQRRASTQEPRGGMPGQLSRVSTIPPRQLTHTKRKRAKLVVNSYDCRNYLV